MVQFSSLYNTRLSRELGTDDSTQLFTTARRKAAINEAIGEFAHLTRCLTRTSTFTVTGGTGEYDLNSTTVITGGDFERVDPRGEVEFLYTDASSAVTALRGDQLPRKDLDWLSREWPDWKESTVASSVMQLPQLYYLRADGPALWLGFAGVPSTGSSASARVVVHYLAQPSALTSDTSEPYTVNSSVRVDLRPYHQALVHYAAAQLEKLRRDQEASIGQLQKFVGYIQRYEQLMKALTHRTITVARRYFSEQRAARTMDAPDRPSSLR